MPFSFSHIKNINLANNHCFFVLFCREKIMTQNFCNFCHVAFKSLKTILLFLHFVTGFMRKEALFIFHRQIWLLNILNRFWKQRARSKHSKLNWIWSLSKKKLGKLALKKGVIDLCPTNSKEYWWVLNLVLATRHF